MASKESSDSGVVNNNCGGRLFNAGQYVFVTIHVLVICNRVKPASETPITPIIIGDGKLTMEFSRELFKEGVLGTGIAFPTVPEGKARVRTIMSATHTKEELNQALEVLKTVGKRMGILGN